MDKKRLRIIIMCILLFTWIGFMVDFFVGNYQKKKAAQNIALPDKKKAEDLDSGKKKGERPLVWSKRDPFEKVKIRSDIPLQLAGILWDPDSPSAILNDQIVAKGDQIGHYTVVSISETTVIVNDGSGETVLNLHTI